MRHVQRALREARRVLAESNVSRAPVDVYRLARKYAKVVEVEMDDGISGMLVPLATPHDGKPWAIVVNDDHAMVRKRFTVAHELAHLLLHGYTAPHADRGFKVRLRSNYASDASVAEEIEANQFAAELLMPQALILQRLRELEIEYAPSVDEDNAVAILAREFNVSQQALSIRLSTLLV